MDPANAQRRRAEEALQRESDFKATVLDTVDALVITLDLQGRIVTFNRACERCSGYTFEEVRRRFLFDFLLAPEESAAVKALFEDLKERALPRHFENDWLTKDGRRRRIEWSDSVLRGPTGAIEYVIGTGLDVTERRQAEAERARLVAILESTSDYVGTATPDTRLAYLNAAGRKLVGLGPDEDISALRAADLHSARNYEIIQREAVPTAIRTGVWRGETVLRHRNGTDIPVSQVIMAHRSATGTVEYFSTIIRDISERKRANEALQESEKRYRLLFNSISDAVFVHEAAGADGLPGRFIEANDAACARLGYTRDELLQMRPMDIDAPETIPAIPAMSARLRVQNRAVWEGIHVARDGRRIPVEISNIVFSLNGKPVCLATARDITDRKQAEAERAKLEAQLRQAQKMEAVGQLAGGVAHDFNNILTAILGQIDLTRQGLLDRLPPDDAILQGLHLAEQSALRAAGLTRQLLAFSRRQVSQPVVLDLNATLNDMENMFTRLLTENIALSLNLAPQLAYIRADLGQVEQVVMNLVVNARDAMPNGGRLLLETTNLVLDEESAAGRGDARPGPYVALVVSDTGCGMDAAVLEHLFEPFFTTKPVGEGTGLGLATVYGIVKQAGGHVAVYSEPGRGTTFRVCWPAVSASAAQSASAPRGDEVLTGTETILLCEDNDAVRLLAERFLSGAGYTVLVAARGDEALALAAKHRAAIDLLVTDVVMPDINGRKLAEALTSNRPALKTLFVSGYPANVIAHHGVLDEGVEFLEKPFGRKRLLARVRAVLDGRHSSTDAE